MYCYHILIYSITSGSYNSIFQNIEKPFLEALKEILGDRYTEYMDETYRITIRLILSNLAEGFNSASGSQADGVTAQDNATAQSD